jgi:hypothetical protein
MKVRSLRLTQIIYSVVVAIGVILLSIIISFVLLKSLRRTTEDKISYFISADAHQMELNVDNYFNNVQQVTALLFSDKGYYLYDEGQKASLGNAYGDSRFVAFKYPGEQVNAAGEENPAYLKVYFDYGGNSYQVAKFTLIFDKDTSTLPWTSVNGSDRVQGSDRDPNELAKTADLIAKISFDYPKGATYKTASGKTAHNNGIINGWWTEIQNSSPLPLTFDNTNYGFDGENPSWGSYAMVSTMPTRWGNEKTALPVDHETYGYNIAPDDGMESAFLYIDASEQPGDICQIPFTGEFCSGDKLMCTGWISGSNRVINDNRCPGSVTITVKGSRKEGGETVTDDIYRFCPGQC